MKFFERLKIGAIALAVMDNVKSLLRWVQAYDIIAILGKIVEAERNFPRAGKGQDKWLFVAQWFASTFPGNEGALAILKDFVNTVVALFNVLTLFRKNGGNGSTIQQ